MVRSLRASLILCAIFVLIANLSWAQRQTGAIEGLVFDQGHAVLPGVTVTLKGSGVLTEQTFITNETGEFRFPSVPPGVYSVTTALQGFQTAERTGLTITVDM